MERGKSNEEDPVNRSIIFLDVDNTLTQGFTIFPFTTFLQEKGLISNNTHEQVFLDKKRYEDGEINYHQFALDVVSQFYEGLEGQSESDISTAGEEFLDQYQETLMPFARELVDIMKQEGELVVVSGAQREAFLPLAKTLGIYEQNLYLLEGEVVDGKFTGRVGVNMALHTEKRGVVQQFEAEGLDHESSFAFGDSISDLPILDAVTNHFLVEPNNDLRQIAESRGWEKSIVDRNSILPQVRKRILELKSENN